MVNCDIEPATGVELRWFTDALACKSTVSIVPCAGADLEVVTWGAEGVSTLIFLSGMLGHAHWWDFIAPFFADRFRCVALSLSGMGQSGWRDQYSIGQYVTDLDTVLKANGGPVGASGPVIVGHSFGGIVARKYLERHSASVRGIILVDSPVRATGVPWKSRFRTSTHRQFASVEAAVQRFSLLPAQPCPNRVLLDHVAAASLTCHGDYWTWSFDPALHDKMDRSGYDHMFAPIDVPLAFVWGGDSAICPAEMRDDVDKRFPGAQSVTIPGAAHHIMFDQPLALVAALRSVLTSMTAQGVNRSRL
jgi:pimeloyl-ACP methyl ester carboxylesterase